MNAAVALAWLTPAQRDRYDQLAASLGRPVSAGMDEALLATFAVAQERYQVAAERQALLDGGSQLPLLSKAGGRVAASPYLAVMDKAANQMARAAQQLGFRAAPRPAAFGVETDDPGALAGPSFTVLPSDDPEPIADAGDVGTVTKRELCLILRIARPTLDAWIDRFGTAFPIVERGTNGRGYRFDPYAVTEFLRGRQEENAAKKAERDEQLAQLLLPLSDTPATPGAISLEDQIKAERLNVIRLENQRKAGALVPVVEIEAEQMAFMASLSRNLQAWGRQFGRTKGWPEALIREIEGSLAALQRATVREHINSAQLDPEPEQELAFG